MSRLLAFLGLFAGAALGWFVGAQLGFVAAFVLSTVGSGVGLYAGRRIVCDYF